MKKELFFLFLILLTTFSCKKLERVNPLDGKLSKDGINFKSNGTQIGSFQNDINDIDGNTYKTVKIGNQVWMAENLKTSKYTDGTLISYITDKTQWSNQTTGAWCYYNNDTANNAKYGKLYNWYAVSPTTNGNKNICPSGWHVPTDAEWTVLTDYLGGESVAGGKMKEVGTSTWNSPNTNATNESGFTGLPAGGYNYINNGFYSGIGNVGYWWSSTSTSSTDALWSFFKYLDNANGSAGRTYDWKRNGLSIRCLEDENFNLTTNKVQEITFNSATSGGTFETTSSLPINAKGVCWSTTNNPTINDNKTNEGTGSEAFTSQLTGLNSGTTYYVRAYAINAKGSSYGNEVVFNTIGYGQNITDIEGNTYKTVTIGSQIWMAENLKTSKYNDGTIIPNITDNTQWENNTTGAWSFYNNDDANNAKYGKLYNWYAVSSTTNGNKNVCPTGWHVPTDAEWTVLTDYLGGESVAGGKMKEVGTTSWYSPNTGATNESGFTGLPGGLRSFIGYYGYIGLVGYWWSSAEGSTVNAWYRDMGFAKGTAGSYNGDKRDGLSLRCLRD